MISNGVRTKESKPVNWPPKAQNKMRKGGGGVKIEMGEAKLTPQRDGQKGKAGRVGVRGVNQWQEVDSSAARHYASWKLAGRKVKKSDGHMVIWSVKHRQTFLFLPLFCLFLFIPISFLFLWSLLEHFRLHKRAIISSVQLCPLDAFKTQHVNSLNLEYF